MTSALQPAEREPVAIDEAAVDEAIAVCRGDMRATIKALLLAGLALEEQVEHALRRTSAGYLRSRPSRDPQYYGSHAVHLPVATADTGRLLLAARDALKAVWKQGYSYKKAGVMLLDLCPAARVQGDLWTEPDSSRSQALMKAVDAINRDFGRDTVAYAAAGRQKAWKLRSDQKSARFTTCWHELLRV